MVGRTAKGGAMTAAVSSRQAVLDQIQKATRTVQQDEAGRAANYAAAERSYVHQGKLSHPQVVELMIERLREYDAEVVETTPAELVQAYSWLRDTGLASDEINSVDGVVTACFAAVADSGTIVLHHSETEGRRVITLLPDWQLVVLKTSQIVETLPEYFSRVTEPPRLMTSLSGPSATADIEMTRIKGVHGPRFLNVILVHDA